MCWLINYFRECFCKHEFEYCECKIYDELGYAIKVKVSLFCPKCGYHKNYAKF